MSSRNEPRIITPAECADYLRCHITTVYKMVRRREMPFFAVGTNIRFDRELLDAWMQEKHVNWSLPGSRPPKPSA